MVAATTDSAAGLCVVAFSAGATAGGAAMGVCRGVALSVCWNAGGNAT